MIELSALAFGPAKLTRRDWADIREIAGYKEHLAKYTANNQVSEALERDRLTRALIDLVSCVTKNFSDYVDDCKNATLAVEPVVILSSQDAEMVSENPDESSKKKDGESGQIDSNPQPKKKADQSVRAEVNKSIKPYKVRNFEPIVKSIVKLKQQNQAEGFKTLTREQGMTLSKRKQPAGADMHELVEIYAPQFKRQKVAESSNSDG